MFVVIDLIVRSRSISENHSDVLNPLECGVFMITRFSSPKRVFIFTKRRNGKLTNEEEAKVYLNNE